jgi:hypothetical protein
MGARYDFTIKQGATITRVLTRKYVSTGLPVDLTGHTAVMHIKESADSSTILARSDGTSPTITLTLGGALGTITFTIAATVTAAFDFETAEYDIKITRTADSVITYIPSGTITLEKRVTV